MYVAARKPNYWLGAPGNRESTDPRKQKVTSYTGAVTETTANVLVGISQRSAPLKGAKVLNADGTVMWRHATNFFRIVHDIEHYPGAGYTQLTATRRNTYEGYRTVDFSRFSQGGFPPRFGNSGDVSSWDTNLGNRARTEALVNLQQGKVHVASSVAEARRSADALAKSAIGAMTFLRKVRRGQRPSMKLSDISDGYLSVEYGFKPIINDIVDIVPTVKDAFNKTFLVDADQAVFESGAGARPATAYVSPDSGYWRELAYCKLVGKLDDKYQSAAQSLGLSPITAAWELVPWSFALDWLMPVGTFLEALTATAGLQFYAGFETKGMEAESEGEFPGGFGAVTTTEQRYSCRSMEMRRFRLYDFPRPVPYLKSPFSTKHVVNAVALFTSMKKR